VVKFFIFILLLEVSVLISVFPNSLACIMNKICLRRPDHVFNLFLWILNPSRELSSEAVMQQFSGEQEESPERKIELQRKHEILFMMGVALLVLLFLTATMGIAMVAFEKDVFVAHIILAGLTLTLATVHAATSIAWFWPY